MGKTQTIPVFVLFLRKTTKANTAPNGEAAERDLNERISAIWLLEKDIFGLKMPPKLECLNRSDNATPRTLKKF